MNRGSLSRVFYVVVIAAAFGVGYVNSGNKSGPVAAQAPAPVGTNGLPSYDKAKVQVTMYSLTTCPYCKAMRRDLTARNIPFVEYFIDAEPGRMQEVTSKLERAGYRPGAIGTPIMEVNGKMLPNNPSLRTVLQHLQG